MFPNKFPVKEEFIKLYLRTAVSAFYTQKLSALDICVFFLISYAMDFDDRLGNDFTDAAIARSMGIHPKSFARCKRNLIKKGFLSYDYHGFLRINRSIASKHAENKKESKFLTAKREFFLGTKQAFNPNIADSKEIKEQLAKECALKCGLKYKPISPHPRDQVIGDDLDAEALPQELHKQCIANNQKLNVDDVKPSN